jgi:putative sugar O-methyltransferase
LQKRFVWLGKFVNIMIYSENEAIQFLVNHLEDDEKDTSAHWKKFHKKFTVGKDLDISGIMGFGGNAKEYKGIEKWVHRILQRKYRKMGNEFSSFKSIDSIASDMTRSQGRAYDLDVLRQTLALSFLMEKASGMGGIKDRTVTVIGDGFASMSLLLLLSGFAKKIILINLSKTLLVDLLYFQKNVQGNSSKSFALITEESDIQLIQKYDLVALQASNHELLTSFPIDLFINIASMQEMNPETISSYFKDFRQVAKQRDTYFYCCNRIEKSFPDGIKVKFSEYPWNDSDQILTDELCPWHQEYYTIFPPMYHRYDGPHKHRLIKVAGVD